MPARFQSVSGDQDPDFQKQIGCMTGIFQMFERQHLLTGRRLNGHIHMRLPSGHAPLSDSYLQAESQTGTPQMVLMDARKNLKGSHIVLDETSRGSSSSSCSSFSSAECNKSNQWDYSLYERAAFPGRYLKSSTSQVSYIDQNLHPPPCQELQEPCTPSRQSSNFGDFVKDSIHRNSTGSLVNTSRKEQLKKHTIRHGDSPRPLPLPVSMDGSYLLGINEKPRMSRDLKEPLWVLAKLKEAPQCFLEDKEPSSSYAAKEGPFVPVQKETSRFSCDGREISCPSLDSRDNSRYCDSLRELPRLSLDSRQMTLRHSCFGSKSNSLVDCIGDSKVSKWTEKSLSLQQDLASYNQPSSVVAKLMGLEKMPLSSRKQDQLHLSNGCPKKHSNTLDGLAKISPSPKSPRLCEESKQEQACSLKGNHKISVTPWLGAAEPTKKPISNSRLPIEAAPWRQHNKSHGTQKIAFGSNGRVGQPHESVYSEIERKLRGLDIQQPNKDIRALKHILASIQAKGLIETEKAENRFIEMSDDNYSNVTASGYSINFRTTGRQKSQGNQPDNTLMKASNTPRPLESPIVIMKPAISVNRAGNPASSVHFSGLSTLRRVHTDNVIDARSSSVSRQTAKEPKSKTRMGQNANEVILCTDKKPGRHGTGNSSQKAREMSQPSSRHPQPTREIISHSVKTLGPSSPRLKPKKNDLERKSRTPTPPESTKQQKQSKYASEPVSPRGKFQMKTERCVHNNGHSSVSSETWNLSHCDDESSLRTERKISFTSQLDVEVTSADRSAELGSIVTQHQGQSPLGNAMNNVLGAQGESLPSFGEDAATELATTSQEHPSPVSVLDSSFYVDDQPLSPVNKISNLSRGVDAQSSAIPRAVNWKRGSPNSQIPQNPKSEKSSSTLSHKKLESIENLLQKLRRLSTSDGQAPAADHIASLCENQNPEHRYVSEMLLASGLLLQDVGFATMATVPVQLHRSGYPINPDLFLVLEQTKTSTINLATSPGHPHDSTVSSKPDSEKLRRKLLFDTVNEILIRKLDLTGPVARPKTTPGTGKLAKRAPTGKQLLKELCLEIERLQAHSHRGARLTDGKDDSLKSILCEDVTRQSGDWLDTGDREVACVVLDIERFIFKDLVDEVVKGEPASSSLPAKPGSRRRRQQPLHQVRDTSGSGMRKHSFR